MYRVALRSLAAGLPLLFLFAPAAPAANGPCGDRVEVVAGDTMGRIAARCGVPPRALIRANADLANPSLLTPGMVLAVPDVDVARERASGGIIAEEGDTFVTISERHGIPLAILMAANDDIAADHEIEAGTLVVLP